ncbi:MAG: amidohydrolase family protein [Saprospiraceae bacterium]|nr:amidohydrolase family protein [Saprospiraceae bacterium]
MLIDANAHIGHWPFRHRAYNTCATLLSRMDEFGVDKAIISNMSACLYKNPQTANAELVKEINSITQSADRFYPLGVINPLYGGWMDDVKICHEEYGMKGIKIYPKYHGYEIDDPICEELIERAHERGLAIAIPLRVVDSRPSSWLDIVEEFALSDILSLIAKVPDAKFLIQNVSQRSPLSDEEIELVRSTDTVIDTSGKRIDILESWLGVLDEDSFCFGTHSPILDYCTGLLRIESLTASEADAAVREKLRSGNIQKLLAI